MCATGSNDVVITDVFVPAHRLVRVSDIYTGTAPGAALHDADTYRWPMVPALALLAAMPALGSAERAADIYAERLSQRVLAYEGVTQKDKPIAQAHLGEARVRLRALRGLLADTVGAARNHRRRRRSRAAAGARRGAAGGGPHRARVASGDRPTCSRRPAPAPTSSTTRCSGSSATSTCSAGHVVFDYDTSRELAGALILGMEVPRTAMV